MRVPGKAALAAMCADESPVKSHWVPAESRTLFAPLELSSVLRGSTRWLIPAHHCAFLSFLVTIPAILYVIRTVSVSVHKATSKPLSTAELGKSSGFMTAISLGPMLVLDWCAKPVNRLLNSVICHHTRSEMRIPAPKWSPHGSAMEEW